MITVTFEDHGQDFLEWDIEDGVVVDCRPFQSWLWNGTKVHNTDIHPGDILEITDQRGEERTLKYPVERVVKHGSRTKESRAPTGEGLGRGNMRYGHSFQSYG
jgi:hypothetical protein